MKRADPPAPISPINSLQVAIPGVLAILLAIAVGLIASALLNALQHMPQQLLPGSIEALALLLGAVAVLFIVATVAAALNVQRALRLRDQYEAERKLSEEALRQQNEVLTALHETALALLNRRELISLLDSIIARAEALLDTPHGYIDLSIADGSSVRQEVGHGLFTEHVGQIIKLDEGLAGQIHATGQPLVLSDYSTWTRRAAIFNDVALHAIVGVPLKTGKRIIGVLGLAHVDPTRQFTPTQVELITRFAELASLAIDNARLYEAMEIELAERKRAEEAAERERDFAVQVMNSLGQGVAVADTQGQYIYVNPTFAQLVGRQASELVGKDAMWLVVPEDRARVQGALSERRTGGSSSYEVRLLHAQGHPVPVLVTGSPRWVGGTNIGSIAIVTDLTERQKTELVREAIYRIAQATAQTESLEGLFPVVHSIIGSIMPAGNFYIALYDAQSDLLSFPYFVDEVDQPGPPQKPGRGLTEYVLRTGQSLLCDAELDLKLQQAGETDLVGVSMAVWLGVPLVVEGRVIGVMVVQHYSNPNAYSENELHILEFVSSEVARAIDRKRAADALRESEARFSHIFHNAPVAISLSDEETGAFIDCNESFCQFSGYRRDEILGRSRSQIGLWASPQERQRVLDKLDRDPVLKNEIILYQTKAGNVRSVLVSSELVGISGRQCRLSMLIDMTERAAAEHALRQSEERFRVLADNIPGVIYQCLNDDRYTMLYLNEAIEGITGHSKAEFLQGGLSLNDFEIDADVERDRSIINAAIANHGAFNVVYRVRHKSGEWRWVEEWGTGVYGPDNNLLFLEGFLSDITERKEAEEGLRNSEERFRVLAQNIPGVIYQCKNDDRYTFIYLNDAIDELTGYPKEAFLEQGLSFFDLYHPDDAAWMPVPSRSDPAKTWEPFHLTYRIRHKSGEWRWVEEWGTGVFSYDKAPQFLEGFMIDVTERKRAEEALARTVRELAALDHMGKAAAASLDLSVVLSTVIEEVSPLLNSEGISVLLPEGENKLVFAAASGPASSGLVGHRIPRMAGVAGGVIQTAQSVMVISGESESQLYREVERVSNFHTRSLLAVPLILGGEVIGVMEAVHTQPYAFSASDQRLLEAAANWAAIAIGNAHQHERLQRRLRESEALASISRALNETLDLDHTLQLIVESALRVIPKANRAVIDMYDEARNVLTPVAASGGRPLGDSEVIMRPGEGVSGRVFLEGSLINVANTTTMPGFIPGPSNHPLLSMLSVPVESGARRLGTLNLDSPEASAFSEEDERLLTNLGVQAALAIENARLFDSLQQRADELNTSSSILRAINTAPNALDAFPEIATSLKALTRCDRVNIGVYDRNFEWFIMIAMDEPSPTYPVGTRITISDSPASEDLLIGRHYYDPHINPNSGYPVAQRLHETGFNSWIALPLNIGERTTGALTLTWLKPDGLQLSQLPLLNQIANAIALAVEKSQLFKETTEALGREQRLNEVTRAISSALDVPTILNSVTRLAAEVTGAEAASLALITPDHEQISSIHLYNFESIDTQVPVGRGNGVAWQVIDTGKPLILDEYSRSPDALSEWVEAGARAFLGVPVAAGAERLGVLGLFRFTAGFSFNERDVAVAESVGRQAGIAIQNARLFEALTQEKRRIELLYNISQNLTTLNPYEVANRAIEQASSALGVDVSHITVLQLGTDRLRMLAVTGRTYDQVAQLNEQVQIRVDNSFAGQTLILKKAMIAGNVTQEPLWLSVSGLDDGIVSVACLPLLAGDSLVGVLTFMSKQPHFFKPEQLPTLAAVATPVALALQNAQFFEAERQRVAALTALHETGLELTTQLDLPTLLHAIVERAAVLLNAPMGALSLLLPDGETLELLVSYNLPPAFIGTRLKLGEGATGMVAVTARPLIVDDYTQWPLQAEVYREAPFRSIASVPIQWRGQVMGVISVNAPKPNAFSLADTELVSLFADQAAVAIANARQHQELQRRLQESDAIASISRALNETLDLQRLLQLIVETARRVIPNVERAVIHMLDKDGQTLRASAVSGQGKSGQSVTMRTGEGVAGQVIAYGQVINVGDTHTDPRYLMPERASTTRSLLVAPIHSATHRVGTISVNSITPNAFSADDERLIGMLGTQAALAIYNAQLFEDTRRQLDELVLLHTVAFASSEATSEDDLIARATRLMSDTFYPTAFGIMLIDEVNSVLRAHASYESGPPGYRIPLGQGITGRVAVTGQPWLVANVRSEQAYVSALPKTRSELCVPLKAGNVILGVINAESERVDAFTETDLRLLSTLAGQLATAIQRLRLIHDLEHSLKQEKSTRAQLVQSEKLAAMGRLVASVAHELNNPLQAIQNALYLVRQEPALSPQAFEDLQVASTESNRMAELINRLRETYRPAASEEFRFESLNTIVTDVHKLITTHLRHNSIEFKFEADPDLPYIPGIRDQLKQVLLNLSLNAVEAMPTGGRLTIRTHYESATNQVLLAIQDTGLGIAPDIMANVFDPFFTTKESGTGLGLTITYDIIQRHKGRVEIESETGKGTTFNIWLPVEIQSKVR